MCIFQQVHVGDFRALKYFVKFSWLQQTESVKGIAIFHFQFSYVP